MWRGVDSVEDVQQLFELQHAHCQFQSPDDIPPCILVQDEASKQYKDDDVEYSVEWVSHQSEAASPWNSCSS